MEDQGGGVTTGRRASSEDGRADTRTLAGVLRSAAALAASADVDEALRSTLDLICAYTGWPVGHVYRYDDASEMLVPTEIWHAEGAGYRAFMRASRATPLPSGVGLPGRILATGAPAWIADIRTDPNFPRAAAASRSSIGAGFGFPLVSSRGIEGVMEFFAATVEEADSDLLELMAHLGFQLGGVFDRERAQLERVRAIAAHDANEARLVEAQRIAHMGSWSWRVGEDVVDWSAELHRIYGVEQGDGPVAFAEYLARVHPDDRERVRAEVENALATGEPFEHEYHIIRADGAVRWVRARGEVIERDGERPLRLGGYCQDITAQREAEQMREQAHLELANQQRVLERIARGEPVVDNLDLLCRDVEARYPGAHCTVLLVDSERGALYHTAAPSLPEGFAAALDGMPVAEGAAACGTAAARNRVVVVSDINSDPLTADYVGLAREYGLRSVWSQPLATPAGEVLGTFAVYRSTPHQPDRDELLTVAAAANLATLAIERDRAQRALTTAARVDPLTGLPNRTAFLEHLTGALAQRPARVTVMFLDLDRFKWINDSIGHPAGDRILVEAGARLRDALSDGVAHGAELSRFGGDEFTVVLTDPGADVDAVAHRVLGAFTEPFTLDGGEFFLGVSIGIASGDHSAGAFELVRDADAAMYVAKESGRGRYTTFDETLRRRAVSRVTLESELRRAIARDEFVMYYQPIIDLRAEGWTGAEALVRWQHPTRGLVTPENFIPLAEETGLILPLGVLILDHVMEQLALWRSQGVPLKVAANVSVVQLTDPSFSAAVADSLSRHGLAADALSLEVTETAVMDQYDDALATLTAIGSRGIAVAIDDFGTGHSSIARIRELPVTSVKIDRRFVKPLGVDTGADRVLAAMTDLAHALGLTVVAEGVETEVQLAKVRLSGCDCAQGFHLARPAPADEVLRVLRGQ